MPVQDLVFGAGSLGFIAALLPSVFGDQKPDLRTSLATGFVLAAFSVSYATLELWFASATAAATSALWFVLAGQRVRCPA